MKNIKTYNNFINESLKDKLKGKSEKEILNNVKDLSPEEKLKKGAKYGILSLVKQAIKEDDYISNKFNNAMRIASANDHLNVVKYLLKDDRVDPSDLKNAAIRYTSEHGYLNVVKELMKDKRVDPSDIDNYAIHYASEHGYLEIVKELLKDERVRNKLNKENLEKYKNQISNLNESLKNEQYFLYHKTKNNNKLKIVLLDENKREDNNIIGYIYLNQYTPNHWEVLSVAADKGYGYIMYDTAMDFLYDDYIMPSRNKEIKKSVLNIYKKYKNRDDVIVEEINKNDDNYIPIDEKYNDLFNIKIKLKNKLNFKFKKDTNNFILKNGLKFFNKKYDFDVEKYKL